MEITVFSISDTGIFKQESWEEEKETTLIQKTHKKINSRWIERQKKLSF